MFNFLDISPRHIGIMGKHGEPLLWNSASIVSFAIFQHFHREKIVGHGPDRIEMPGGGNQIRDVAGSFAAAANKDSPHVACVSRPDLNGNSRSNLRVTVD